MATTRAPGPLRDARVGLPVALVLLLLLGSFTVLSYRNGTRLLVAARQGEAVVAARAAAESVGGGELPRAGELRALHPAARRMALADATGAVLGVVGEPLDGDFAAPLSGGRLPDDAVAVGPSAATRSLVVAFAPLPGSGAARWLRLDLAEPVLAGQRRVVGVLTWTVLGASAAVLLWLLLFLRQLLRPYEALLRRARELGGGEVDDEGALLLATVERALAAARGDHASDAAPAGGDAHDLEVLERTLTSSLESGLLLLDREGRVLALNPAGAALLGPPPPPRTPLAELLAAQPELLALLAPAVAAGEGLNRRECDVFAGGEPHRIGLTMTPLRRPSRRFGPDDGLRGGELLGYLVLFADLTASEREGHQARLAESLAHLGELSAGVAHELRNGLATLGGYLTLLERDLAASDRQIAGEYLAELRGETQRLQRVVADFLGFTHPGTARLVDVDLAALVRHAARDPALDGAALRIDEPVAEPSAAGAADALAPILAGDPQLLERALRNLLRNALEAQQRSGAETPVEVAAGWREDRFEIAIRDRGPGVSPEMRRRLFQPFATDRPGGVGMGLALAHRIVALHGGTLTLEPRAGGGTVARVTFARERFAAR
ncbi:MAG TPA: ATP-binding protein [Thermoanaerobaculia bacterium]|nr:ATP-binding protein [Thermoanaerobaculia bacterium]